MDMLNRNEHPETKPFEAVGTGVDARLGTGNAAGRRDGRSPNEMRALTLSQGTLLSADGSARIKLGHTDVLVAIYGPMHCPVPRQNAEEVLVHVSFRRREAISVADGANAGREALAGREIRNVVRDTVLACLYPRKAVVVAVQVLSDAGAVLAAALNATVMALIDAGVPMQAVPTAACVAVHNGVLFVDPLLVEEMEADALLTFIFDTFNPDHKGFISVYTDGDCNGLALFDAALNTSRDLAAKTTAFLKLSLQQKAQQHLMWNTTKN